MRSPFKIWLRRDSAASLAEHAPILHAGEIAVDLDSRHWRIGDGSAPWGELPDRGEWPYWDGEKPCINLIHCADV